MTNNFQELRKEIEREKEKADNSFPRQMIEEVKTPGFINAINKIKAEAKLETLNKCEEAFKEMIEKWWNSDNIDIEELLSQFNSQTDKSLKQDGLSVPLSDTSQLNSKEKKEDEY